MSITDLSDLGVIGRELFVGVRDLTADIGLVCPPRAHVEVAAIIDVPRLGLELRLLHVHELPEDGLTFRALL